MTTLELLNCNISVFSNFFVAKDYLWSVRSVFHCCWGFPFNLKTKSNLVHRTLIFRILTPYRNWSIFRKEHLWCIKKRTWVCEHASQKLLAEPRWWDCCWGQPNHVTDHQQKQDYEIIFETCKTSKMCKTCFDSKEIRLRSKQLSKASIVIGNDGFTIIVVQGEAQ